MGFKLVVLILSAFTTSTRSQLPQPQPVFFRPPDNRPPNPQMFHPGEPAFITNLKNIPPPPPSDPRFLNFQSFIIPQPDNRGAMFTSERNHIGPNNQRGGIYDFMNQLIQPSNQNSQFINTNLNQNSQTQDNTKHKNEMKTNAYTQAQQNNSPPNVTKQEQNVDASKSNDTPSRSSGTIHNQGPKTTNLNENNVPRDNATIKQFNNNNKHLPNSDTNSVKKTVKNDKNVDSGRSNNSNVAKPVVRNASPVTSAPTAEGKTGADNMDGDSDRWIWDVTEMPEVTATTPDVDNRAAFDGEKCSTGKVKVNNVCVIED